ncbi:MAG: four helix bundle protein, partial [Gemmatimonadota bacterium]|nr:four helix bundle protein [Gemmatimonadota bacterium]
FDNAIGACVVNFPNMAPYERYDAWRACHKLALLVYKLTETFPSTEKFGLTIQARRAAYSAAANIVEGCSKRGAREFRRYLDVSMESLNEIEYAFRLAKDLNILSQENWEVFLSAKNKAGRLTWGLYRSIAALSSPHRN